MFLAIMDPRSSIVKSVSDCRLSGVITVVLGLLVKECNNAYAVKSKEVVCLFVLILYVPSTIFQLYRDGSSWVEPVLS